MYHHETETASTFLFAMLKFEFLIFYILARNMVQGLMLTLTIDCHEKKKSIKTPLDQVLESFFNYQ